jgi:parallel beta-helix repeat protein
MSSFAISLLSMLSRPAAAEPSRRRGARSLLSRPWRGRGGARARPRLEVLEDRTLLSPFVVTNTLDDGSVGSLRWAINQANADTDPASVINFNIAASGVQTIQVGSSSAYAGQPLPAITHPVTIDGSTEPGFAGTPLIELNGTNAGSGANGLNITSGNSTVRGLVINSFGQDGILLSGGGSDVIAGNYIGTDASGTLNRGNALSGIMILSSGNTVGGLTGTAGTGAGNVISGNKGTRNSLPQLDGGVSIDNASNNFVEGNLIGTNAAGTGALGNSFFGVVVAGTSTGNQIGGTAAGARNVVSASGRSGIVFVLGATGDSAVGNYVGTDVTGNTAIGNPSNGILIQFDGDGNTIQGNVVSGNGIGINIIDAKNNVVQGNLVGTNAAGTTALGNTGISSGFGPGVAIYAKTGSATGNLIGGTTAAARNVISANKAGVWIQGAAATGNTVEGNYIGTDATGTATLGNTGPGVELVTVFVGVTGANNNTIGGRAAGAGNLIAGNGRDGILLTNFNSIVSTTGSGVVNNLLVGNSIHDNGGLGIDLGGTGTPVPNDSAGHVGPNNYQNFPVLTAATFGPTTTTVSGHLNSSPDGTYTLDFYASPAADPSGYGQGKYYLGSTTVTTVSGIATFTNISLTTPAIQGDAISVITATATDSAGNTSEFSQAFTLNDVTVLGTPGNDSIALTPGATPGSVAITMNGSPLGTFSPAGQVLVYGQGGSDTYTVNFGSNLTTPITLSGNGAASNDTLVANGVASSSPNYINKTSGQITWGSPVTETVHWTNIPNQTINAMGAGQNYVIDPGGNTIINGGPGTNTITITATTGNGVVINGGPNANNYVITMGNLLGPVTINSTTGTSMVTVNAPPGSNVLTITPSQLTGAGQTINFNLGTTATNVTVAGGAGNNNQLVVVGSPPGPLTVQHVAPTLGAITAPLAPAPINTAISTNATFTDLSLESHTAVWSWGDNTTSAGTVTQSGSTGSVTGSHAYATDGVYTVTLTVTNTDGHMGQATYQYVVVYDPSAGFVTGGGWYTSPAGAYPANPTLTGPANFGFNARYHAGSTVPTGNTDLEFPAAGLTFTSTGYDWLVITTNQAQYQGSGTINGAGSYGFLVTAQDNGGHGGDKIRVEIWDKSHGNAVVYDTQPGAPITAAPTTALGGGRIQVHTGGSIAATGEAPGATGGAPSAPSGKGTALPGGPAPALLLGSVGAAPAVAASGSQGQTRRAPVMHDGLGADPSGVNPAAAPQPAWSRSPSTGALDAVFADLWSDGLANPLAADVLLAPSA